MQNDNYDELEKMFQKAAIETIELESNRNKMLDELMASIESVIVGASKEDRKEFLQRLYALVVKHSYSLK